MKSGLARTVPKLRETHTIRDSWTKLNVAPAKIMQVSTCNEQIILCEVITLFIYLFLQQEQVLSELRTYSQSVPEAKSTAITLEYLQACNNLFERGFLSHKPVAAMDCDTLADIAKGLLFFQRWLDDIYTRSKYTSINYYEINMLHIYLVCIY